MLSAFVKIKRKDYDYLAPDSSEIRLLLTERDASRGSMAHCSLLPGKTSIAASHKTVEELWFFTRGFGELWLKNGNDEVMQSVHSGVALSLPPGVIYQFRNLSLSENLEFVVTTIPHWPGPDEVQLTIGKWQPSVS